MAIEQAPEKKGLLKTGLEPGDSIPGWDDLGIPNRVDKKGELEWQTRSWDVFLLDFTEPLRDYLARKEEQVVSSIFQGLSKFSRAMMGEPVGVNYGGWPVMTLPAPYDSAQVPTFWESAPGAIQTMAMRSAIKYMSPQLNSTLADQLRDALASSPALSEQSQEA